LLTQRNSGCYSRADTRRRLDMKNTADGFEAFAHHGQTEVRVFIRPFRAREDPDTVIGDCDANRRFGVLDRRIDVLALGMAIRIRERFDGNTLDGFRDRVR